AGDLDRREPGLCAVKETRRIHQERVASMDHRKARSTLFQIFPSFRILFSKLLTPAHDSKAAFVFASYFRGGGPCRKPRAMRPAWSSRSTSPSIGTASFGCSRFRRVTS